MKPIKDLDIHTMKRAEFFDLPQREWDQEIGQFNGLILLPSRRKHDSGYMCMDFVACNGKHPICRLSGCSDVLHIGGIGGFKETEKRVWSVDCLKSGLLRLFSDGPMECGAALSSFEIWGKKPI